MGTSFALVHEEKKSKDFHHQGTKTPRKTEESHIFSSWCLLGIRKADTRYKSASGVLAVCCS
jgi:hypothetical protein